MILNDAELRQLTGSRTWSAREPGRGRRRAAPAERGRRQAGRVRRGTRSPREGFFALPAFPLETVSTPPAPATRSPAASSATSPRIPGGISDDLLRRAMAHATVLASFNVEEFGTERVHG